MSILCKLFGHTLRAYRGHGADYGRVEAGAVDGINRQHCALYVRCGRCGEEYFAGSFHREPTKEENK